MSRSGRHRGDLDYVAGEVVLVTGAGGSARALRQIARLGPGKLVLLDHAEPALFEIERELVRDRFLAAAAVVGDVKDAGKLRQVFDKYRPGSSSTRPRTSTSR